MIIYGHYGTIIIIIITCRKLIPEQFVWKVMYQLLLALAECHKSKENEGGKVIYNYYIQHRYD